MTQKERLGKFAKVKKKINAFSFLGMICGFIFGIAWLLYFWDEVSGFIPQQPYRFGTLGLLGFPIVTAIIGILVGKTIELLVHKLRNWF